MRRMLSGWAVAVAVAAGSGCSSPSEPVQPSLTEEQIKEVMQQGKQQALKERGGRSPGGPPLR